MSAHREWWCTCAAYVNNLISLHLPIIDESGIGMPIMYFFLLTMVLHNICVIL